MSAEAIIQHVKSFSSPFSLASCELNGAVFKLASAHRALFALSAKKMVGPFLAQFKKIYL